MLPKFTASLIGLLACALPLAASATAVTEKFAPVADTYVTNGSSGANGDKNYGGGTYFETRNTQHNSAHRLAYVRFDLKDLILGNVTDATLSLTHIYTSLNNATPGSTSTVSVFGLNYNYGIPTLPNGKQGLEWIETTDEDEGITGLTNNNAPWAASNSNTVPSIVTSLGSFTITLPASNGSSSTPCSITGTSSPALINFLQTFKDNGVNDVTFILRSSTDATLRFASKEHDTSAYAPSLSVTYATAAVPEPTTCAALAGLATLILAIAATRQRRRRSSVL